MAVRYFGIEKGANVDGVTQGSSTTSKDVEVTVDLAAAADKQQVLVAIENLKIYITNNIWPPA